MKRGSCERKKREIFERRLKNVKGEERKAKEKKKTYIKGPRRGGDA
jgi:hypothetical protein